MDVRLLARLKAERDLLNRAIAALEQFRQMRLNRQYSEGGMLPREARPAALRPLQRYLGRRSVGPPSGWASASDLWSALRKPPGNCS